MRTEEDFHVESWYLYYHFRKVSDAEYYILALAIGNLLWHFRYQNEAVDSEIRTIFYDFLENFLRNETRVEGSAFYKGFIWVVDSLEKYKGAETSLPTIREWKGNYQRSSILNLLRMIYTIRQVKHVNVQYPKTPREKELLRSKRIRGYTDQGTESTESQRARRRANEYVTEKEIQSELQRSRSSTLQMNWIRTQFDKIQIRE
jgi:hypothetical protein